MINFSFLGDISLNDKYNEFYKSGENPFNNVKNTLLNSQFVIGNLECLASGNKGENLLKKPRLKTKLETLNYLKDLNLGLVLLAHNHVYDNLEEGFVITTNFLKNNNINYIGAGLSKEEAEKPYIYKFNGNDICFLNYVTKDTNPNLPDDATVFLNWFDEIKVIADIIKHKKKVDKVILCLHWGGKCEGGYYPFWDQPQIAKILINAGADLIIGHHSHTIQPYEIYKGKYIFYSLGNFCFSDFVFENKRHELPSRWKETMLVNVEFSKLNYNVKINFFRNQITYYKYDKSYFLRIGLRNFLFKWVLKIKFIWNFYFFSKKHFLPLIMFLLQKETGKTEKLSRIYRSLIKRAKN